MAENYPPPAYGLPQPGEPGHPSATKQAATCPDCGSDDPKVCKRDMSAVKGGGIPHPWGNPRNANPRDCCSHSFHSTHPVSADEWWTIWVCDECGTITEWEETEGKPLCDGASIEVEGGGYLTEEEAEQDHKWTPMRRIVVVPEARAAEAERDRDYARRDEDSLTAENGRLREALERLILATETWSVSDGHQLYRQRSLEAARAVLTPKHPQDE